MDFYQRVAHYLTSEFPAQAARQGDASLYATIKAQIALAHLYRFTTETEAVKFIDLLWRIGPDFDTDPTYPWAQEILTNPRIPQQNKITLLRESYALHRAQKAAERV